MSVLEGGEKAHPGVFMLLRIFSCDLVEYCLSFLSSFML